jgi:hypothetical protein
MKYLARTLTTGSLACLAFSVASADLSLGGSKAAGMGGAGLALGSDMTRAGARNPAWYAFKPKSQFFWPSLRFDLDGVKLGDFDEFFDSGSGGALNSDGLGRLARTFGNKTVEAGAHFGLGGQFGAFGLDFSSQGFVTTIPNQSLRTWVGNGSNINNVPADARLDGYGLGMAELGIVGGQKLVTKQDEVAVGGRFKIVRGYYTHYFADANAIVNGGSTISPELGGDKVKEKTGFGIDAGVQWNSKATPGLMGAAVVNNLIEPNVKFDAITPGGALTNRVKPFVRSMDLGLAFDKGPWLAAFDVLDLGNSAGRQELRFGGEIHAGRWVAVRGGYGSRTGWTVGAGLAGFNIAYSGRYPLEASYAFKF